MKLNGLFQIVCVFATRRKNEDRHIQSGTKLQANDSSFQKYDVYAHMGRAPNDTGVDRNDNLQAFKLLILGGNFGQQGQLFYTGYAVHLSSVSEH